MWCTFGVGAYSSTIFSSQIRLMTGSVLFCIISSSSSPYNTIPHDNPLSRTCFRVTSSSSSIRPLTFSPAVQRSTCSNVFGC